MRFYERGKNRENRDGGGGWAKDKGSALNGL